MQTVPNMVMIGGNSRNAGKTSLACNIISKFSTNHEVIGLKVTCIRPDEMHFHGTHPAKEISGFEIFEELDSGTSKDTSRMLRAGASRVYYIRAEEFFVEQIVLHFLSKYINKQMIVCESRSLSEIIKPGLFLMMMRLPVTDTTKDVSACLLKADKVYYCGENQEKISQFVADVNFEKGEFKIAQ